MIEMMATDLVKELTELGWHLIDLGLLVGIGFGFFGLCYGFFAAVASIGTKIKEKLFG